MADWIDRFDIKYMGESCRIPKTHKFYDEYLLRSNRTSESWFSYSLSITKKQRLRTRRKFQLKRVVGLGLVAFPLAIVGAMWKKNHIYTIIQYKDDVCEKIIILDFGDKVDIIQSWIYHRMLSSRRSTTVTRDIQWLKSDTKKEMTEKMEKKYPGEYHRYSVVIDEFFRVAWDLNLIEKLISGRLHSNLWACNRALDTVTNPYLEKSSNNLK